MWVDYANDSCKWHMTPVPEKWAPVGFGRKSGWPLLKGKRGVPTVGRCGRLLYRKYKCKHWKYLSVPSLGVFSFDFATLFDRFKYPIYSTFSFLCLLTRLISKGPQVLVVRDFGVSSLSPKIPQHYNDTQYFMLVHSELPPLCKILHITIRYVSNTLVVPHINMFGSTVSEDVWIRYTILDNEYLMFGHVVHWHTLWYPLPLY